MITLLLTATLQFGSCQATPDEARTAAEAADVFLDALDARDERAMRWVVRPGTPFVLDSETRTDETFYAAMSAERGLRTKMVILDLEATADRVSVVTAPRGRAADATRIVLEFADGCVTRVTIDGPEDRPDPNT